MESILHYSESDFPSLNPKNRRKNASAKSAIHVPPSKKTAVEVEPARVIEIRSSSRSEQNSSHRVLKPHEHEVSYSISISEAIVKTRKRTSMKDKSIIGLKSSVQNEHICGNPLDADNPLRLKGKFGLPKKPKHISRTKKHVMLARENVSKARKLATNITFEAGWIHHDSKLEEENLQDVLYLAKLTEMKQRLMRLNADSDDVPLMEADRSKNKEAIDLLPDQNVTDFRKVLESSSVPIHLLLVHNHNFKRYCDNCISNTLNERAIALVSQIVRFQLNKYQRNSVKAVANKRYVLGFKQTMKYMRMNKIKMIICVPDMEDGMTELVEELKLLANAYSMPYLFALTRRKLGALTYKKVGVCCFGILDYSSAEDNFNRLNEEASAAKRTYREKCLSAVDYCQLNLGITWVGSNNQQGAEKSNADIGTLTAETEEKLRLNENVNIKN